MLFSSPLKAWAFVLERDYSWRDVLVYFTIPLFFLSSFAGIFGDSPEFNQINLPPNWIFSVIFLGSVSAVFLSSWMISAMAPRFKGERSFDKTFALISFSYAPVLFGSIISSIHEILQIVNFVALVYMIFLFWRGTAILLRIPSFKQTGFVLISLLVLFASRVVISAFLASLALYLTGNVDDFLNQ
jgi:hypothetical protein